MEAKELRKIPSGQNSVGAEQRVQSGELPILRYVNTASEWFTTGSSSFYRRIYVGSPKIWLECFTSLKPEFRGLDLKV